MFSYSYKFRFVSWNDTGSGRSCNCELNYVLTCAFLFTGPVPKFTISQRRLCMCSGYHCLHLVEHEGVKGGGLSEYSSHSERVLIC